MEHLRFEDMNISNEICRAVLDMGFEEATPIQSQAIPVILEGKDIIGQSQTGTGQNRRFQGFPFWNALTPRTDACRRSPLPHQRAGDSGKRGIPQAAEI